MKPKKTRLMIFFTVAIIIFTACEKTDDDISKYNDTGIVNHYSGAGSYGDLITFSVNQTDQTYIVNNESTGNQDHGFYEILESEYHGIYKVTANSSTFYAIELSEKIIAANFPTGNVRNDISFGISTTIDNSNNPNLAGNYLCVAMNSNDMSEGWGDSDTGILTIKDDGTWIAGELEEIPNEFTGIEPELIGEWKVDEVNNEKINFTCDNMSLTGYAYATANAGIVLIDLGYGNGFLLGYKIVPSAIEEIEGDYKFIDVSDNGEKGAGHYTINSSGEVTYSHIDTWGKEESGSFSNLSQCEIFTNLYLAEDAEVCGEICDVYLVIIEDFIMHFIVDDSGLFSYGAGAILE